MAIDPTLNIGEVTYADHDPVDVPVPTSLAPGDLMITSIYIDDVDTTVTPPTTYGTWTEVVNMDHATRAMDLHVYWKIAAGEENDATIPFDLGATGSPHASEGQCYRITGHDATTPMDAAAVSDAAENASPRTFPSITTVTDNALIIGIGCTYSGGAWAPTGSPALTERNEGGQVWIGSVIQATAGASTAYTATGPSGDGMTCTLAIRPAGGAATAVKDIIGGMGIIPFAR